MRSIRERANTFNDLALSSARVSWEPNSKIAPHLIQSIREKGYDELSFEQKVFKWDFIQAVAMNWWAVTFAKLNLPSKEFSVVADILETKLTEWNNGTIGAFTDLNNFIKAYNADYEKITDIKEATDFTILLVGTWMLWNLTEKKSFNDEARLSRMLGQAAYSLARSFISL